MSYRMKTWFCSLIIDMKLQTKRKRVHERRDTSPLTDLDDDEDLTNRLREELKERDQELEALRQELKTARRNTAGDEESVGAATVEQTP
jgi:hypothetical protein